MRRNLYKSIVILGLTVVLVLLGFYYLTYLEGITQDISYRVLAYCLVLVVMLAICLSVYLISRMFIIAKQDRLFEIQELHMQQLEEMMNIVKTQRHDFVNHFQTIYGLLQLGEVDEAQYFIRDLYQEIEVTGDVLRLAIPEVSALLLVKMSSAANKNISFGMDIQSNLACINIKPVELVSIIGNLLNNGLEAVEGLEAAERRLSLKIFENPRYYIIQTSNPGFIPDELKARIFTAGFSTRGEQNERGLGLASIKKLVEKNQGRVVLWSDVEKDVRFTICLPKRKGKELKDEHS